MLKIIDYDNRYHENFRQLNLEWLHQYNLLESHDLEILDNPMGNIIDRGGYIYLALIGEEVVGSAALLKEPEGLYELAKMAVSPKHQGKGISKMLMEKCLNKAREIGASKLMLYSNSQLKTAIKVYSKYGFQHVPALNTPFVTADVKMELEL